MDRKRGTGKQTNNIFFLLSERHATSPEQAGVVDEEIFDGEVERRPSEGRDAEDRPYLALTQPLPGQGQSAHHLATHVDWSVVTAVTCCVSPPHTLSTQP